MATVNKNFRIKNGLVVEGSTATVNGEDILTKSAADQSYIVDLIGGQATSANTANTVVKRDANGNFSAGTITADLVGNVTGNASTASALETARTIELTGDITGSVSFDGSSNVQLATTLNADFATDAEVAAAKSEAISAASSDATTKANAAQTAAESYADSLASNYDPAGSASAAQTAAEGYADGLAGDILDGTSDFTALDVNSVSRQVAATTGNISPAAVTTALSWAKASYRSAKIVIKAKNGSHTHVSELIVTLDTSDNIALNEYGITTTNGSLMTIDADISGTDVRVRVTPAHDNTEIMAHATLLV